MRAASLIRSGSISTFSEKSGRSPRFPAGINDAGVPFCRNRRRTTRLSFDMKERTDFPSPAGRPKNLRRVRSDTDLLIAAPPATCGTKWLPPATLPEVEKADLADVTEEEFSGGGMGSGAKTAPGRGGDGRDGGDRDLGGYYRQMLEADPANPLILRNYGKFLHEVVGDLEGAEEYYSRAILASPDDGELLSLYGRLIWESERDCRRANDYYQRAAAVAPNDCYVLGSYAHFLWDAEEDEEEGRVAPSPPLVEVV